MIPANLELRAVNILELIRLRFYKQVAVHAAEQKTLLQALFFTHVGFIQSRKNDFVSKWFKCSFYCTIQTIKVLKKAG